VNGYSHSPLYHVTNRRLDCGDISDVVSKNGVFGLEAECTTACPGDPIHTCGNGNRLNTYYWSGTVNNWRTPANIGRFEVRRLLSCHISLKVNYLINSFWVCRTVSTTRIY
jgi:hypothetical protein